MQAGQIVSGWMITEHFLQRWFERTNLSWQYFEETLCNGALVHFNSHDGTSYNLMRVSSTNDYYVIVCDEEARVLKTVLTERMYVESRENLHNSDVTRLSRHKKQLRKIHQELRDAYGAAKWVVNGYETTVLDFTDDSRTDDVIDLYVKVRSHALAKIDTVANPKFVEACLSNFNIPLKNPMKVQMLIGDEVICEKDVKISAYKFALAKKFRGAYHETPTFENREYRRGLKNGSIERLNMPVTQYSDVREDVVPGRDTIVSDE